MLNPTATLSKIAVVALLFAQACGSSSKSSGNTDVGRPSDANADRGGDATVARDGSPDVVLDGRTGGSDGNVDSRPNAPDTSFDSRINVDSDRDTGSVDTGAADLISRDTGVSDGNSGVTLDSCFADLPAAVGTQLIATKRNSSGTIRIRILLDTENRMGLGYAWGLLRFGAEVNGRVTCITDRKQLNYIPSRHNCTDMASATAGTLRFNLDWPSVSPTRLNIFDGAVQTFGEMVTDVSCTASGRPSCPSNGPC